MHAHLLASVSSIMMLEEEVEFSDDEEEGAIQPSTVVLSPPRPIIPAGLDLQTGLSGLNSIIPPNEIGFGASLVGTKLNYDLKDGSPHKSRTVLETPVAEMIFDRAKPKVDTELVQKLPMTDIQALNSLASSLHSQDNLQQLVLLHSQCSCAGETYHEPMDKTFGFAMQIMNLDKKTNGHSAGTPVADAMGSTLDVLAGIILAGSEQVISKNSTNCTDRQWKKKYLGQALALLGAYVFYLVVENHTLVCSLVFVWLGVASSLL